MDRMTRFKEIASMLEDRLEWLDFCVMRDHISFNNAAWDSEVQEFLEDDNAEMVSGCTKGCIIDWANGYVYKIGFLDAVEDKDAEYADYCEREYNLCCQMSADSAIPKEIFDIFVPVDFVGNYTITAHGRECSIPVYGQEVAEIDEERVYTTSVSNYCKSGNHEVYTDNDLEEQWENFEETEQVELCFPTVMYDVFNAYNINDIHASNVGYINGKLRIFDYAGYGIM